MNDLENTVGEKIETLDDQMTKSLSGLGLCNPALAHSRRAKHELYTATSFLCLFIHTE